MSEQDGITKFWDDYQEQGIEVALKAVRERSAEGNLAELEMAVPFLVEEARNRDIDLLQFLTELDEQLAKEEQENADRANNGTSELPADGSDEADESSDEDEPASSRDADGEDRGE